VHSEEQFGNILLSQTADISEKADTLNLRKFIRNCKLDSHNKSETKLMRGVYISFLSKQACSQREHLCHIDGSHDGTWISAPRQLQLSESQMFIIIQISTKDTRCKCGVF
jgi:hypothetical protein